MDYIKPEENFEPSQQTKSRWRFTRKATADFAGVKLPGLFQTTGFTLDIALFSSVLALEVWGLACLLVASGSNPLFFAFLFLIDISLAIFRHMPEGTINECENRLVIAKNEEGKARLRNKIGAARRSTGLFSFLILCVAVFKIIDFYGLQNGQFTGLTAGIIVSYLLAAYLHINSTGYFLSGLLFGLLIGRDRKMYLNSPDSDKHPMHINQHREFVIETGSSTTDTVALDPVRVERHEITKEGNYYMLRTWGVLEDRHLHVLVEAQRQDTAKRIIATNGVKTQLQIMQSDPAGAVGTMNNSTGVASQSNTSPLDQTIQR